MTFASRLRGSIPAGQLLRYLIVGGCNTLFGYGMFAGLTYLLTGRVPAPYMAAGVIGSVASITFAFLGYKFFVFRTKGNYLREYARCFAVYGVSALINLALLPVLVTALGLLLARSPLVPYIAGAILTGGTVVLSFFGHRHFSFRSPLDGSEPADRTRERPREKA